MLIHQKSRFLGHLQEHAQSQRAVFAHLIIEQDNFQHDLTSLLIQANQQLSYLFPLLIILNDEAQKPHFGALFFVPLN